MPTIEDYTQNTYQYGLYDDTAVSYKPGYLPQLLGLRQLVRSGQATAWDRQNYAMQEQAARAIPLRDLSGLSYNAGEEGTGAYVSGGSPDLGHLMLTLADRLEAGTATPQEQDLFRSTYTQLADQNWRASVPQASDAFSPLGDNLMGALGVLAMGASGGLAAAPLAAGGATAASTLGSIGTLAGVAGTGAGVLGQATDQDWLSTLGLALGAAGGVAGGLGGLSSLANTGVQSLSDAARLAQSAGSITGAAGRASGVPGLQQAGRYLGQAGQLGSIGSGVLPTSVTDWSAQRGSPMDFNYSLDYDAPIGPGLGWDAGGYDYQQYDAPIGPGLGWDAGGYPTGGTDSLSLEDQVRQAIATRAGGASSASGGGLMSILGSIGSGGLAALRTLVGGGGGAGGTGTGGGWLGPLLSTLGSVGAGAIGSNASSDAARLQADALNRGIDLQAAQWQQQQANQAPWMAAGREALGHLTGRMAWEGPQQPGAMSAISGANYALPSATPGWTPQTYAGYTPGEVPQASEYGYAGPAAVQAGDYQWTPGQGPSAADYRYTPGAIPSAAASRWTPGQGPSAADYRYTPGQTPGAADYRWTPGQGPSAADYRYTPGQGPSAANYRYTPGQTPDAAQYASGAPQLYRGAMPGTQVSTLTGQQVLDQDPGAAFRQTEARKALEGSAAARGGLLSGATLGAIQRQSQDLASQEYGNAWQRMMARDTEQYGRNWGQYQQRWGEGVTDAQLGLQTQAQNFGQAMSAAQLREQLQQTATQQGWSQAQTEAAFREQMASQASQQGFGQAVTAAELRERVNQQATQQGWSQAQAEAVFREQMAQQASQQGYAQQMSEAQLREQVNQQATQQGWSQAQAEAVFREQMAQQASAQGFSQALGAQGQQWQQGMAGEQFDWSRAMAEAQQREQGSQFGWNAGMQAQQQGQRERQQYETDLYNRQFQQRQVVYGRDVYQNTTDYDRAQQSYRNQVAELTRQWNQFSSVAGTGQTAVGQFGTQGQSNATQMASLLGQLGTAEGQGALNQGNAWTNTLSNVNSAWQGNAGVDAYERGRRSVLAGLNA